MIGIVKGPMKEEKMRHVADEAVQTTRHHYVPLISSLFIPFSQLTTLSVSHNQQWRVYRAPCSAPCTSIGQRWWAPPPGSAPSQN